LNFKLIRTNDIIENER